MESLKEKNEKRKRRKRQLYRFKVKGILYVAVLALSRDDAEEVLDRTLEDVEMSGTHNDLYGLDFGYVKVELKSVERV